MSPSKKCVYGILAAVLLIWPWVQYGMVQTYHTNPWRFFGWAMYAMPSPGIRLTASSDTGDKIYLQAAELKPWADAFSAKRMHYGDLLTPHELADVILDKNKQIKAVSLNVSTIVLDASTGSIKERKQTFVFSR